jgi:hypothetical protein
MVDMETEVSNALAIEDVCRSYFGYDLKVKHIIADNIETGTHSHATVFETDDGNIFTFCHSKLSLELGDIKHIIRNMGMDAKVYLPPANNPDYFKDYGKQAFQASFPGRHITKHDNLSFYESLALYNPALVHIAAINGEIRGYIPVLETWHKVADYTHKHIQVR